MNTIRSTIAAAAVLAGSVGTVAALTTTDSATAGTSGGSSAAAGRADFTVRAHQGSDTSIDNGKDGFSAGDQDLFAGALTRDGKHVGRMVGTCQTARVGSTTADQLCEFVLHLGHGQITASGSVSSAAKGPGTFTLAILGGTGRYRDAAGQIAVTATNGKTFPIRVSLR
jgi:hypothetical protein